MLTGASGFFGRNVVERLDRLRRDQGDGFVDLDLHLTARRAASDGRSGTTIHQVDLLDHDATAELVRTIRPTHLCHLAWVGPEHTDRYRTPENHRWAEASIALFRAFRAAGGKRLVHLGSCIEYGNQASGARVETQPLAPDTAYGEAKVAVADEVDRLTADLSAAVARVFFAYGPHEQPERLVPSLILALEAGEPIELTEGRQRRDYLDARDVAAAITILSARPDAVGPFNVGSGQAPAVRTIATRLGEVAGRPDLLRFGARPEGADTAAEIVADLGRITEAVGWRPTISLDDGLADATRWWRLRTTDGVSNGGNDS